MRAFPSICQQHLGDICDDEKTETKIADFFFDFELTGD